MRIFDLGNQHVERIDIGRHADFRQKQHVDARAGFDHFNDIAIGKRRVEPVDAHADRARPPVEVVHRGDDVLARTRFVVGCNGIFKIEKNHVGGAAARLFDHFGN